MMTKKPNILIFMTDSTQVGHLGCYGDRMSLTPNLDRLAREGMRFDRAYATSPICHPARSALLTGLYPHANGTLSNHSNRARNHWAMTLDRDLPTTYSMLHQAGYRCGLATQNQGLNPKDIDDLRSGYAVFKQAMRAQGYSTGEPLNTPGRPLEGMPLENPEHIRDRQYVRDGLELLTQYAKLDRPWILSIELDGPHPPCLPLKYYYDRIDPESIELPASLRDSLQDRAPRHRRARAAGGIDQWDDARWRNALRLYRAQIAMNDAMLGEVLQRLSDLGLEEDTLVIFSSDHGDLMGHHGMLTKYGPTMDETILRIPLVVRWPGRIRPGSACNRFVSSTDWLPTFCELAGIDSPVVHGRSLVPLLKGETPCDWRQGIAGTFYGDGNRPYTLRSYRDEHFKYVWDPYGMDEFYDMRADPGERKNLIRDPQMRTRVCEYAEKMAEELRRLDDPVMQGGFYAVPAVGKWIEDGTL